MGEARNRSTPGLARPVQQGTGETRDFDVQDRFQMPDWFEIYYPNEPLMRFDQIATQPMNYNEAIVMLEMLQKDPDMAGKKLFISRVEHTPIRGNFDPLSIQSTPERLDD